MDWHRSVRRKGEMWMAEKITIKGKTIGAVMPCICVPVTEETTDNIIEEIKLLAEKKTDMIEWRMDWFSQVTNRYEVQKILKEVQSVLQDTILLLTFRSQRQGGHMQLSSKEILDIYLDAAETGVPDMIDVEYFEYERPMKALKKLKECGVYTISSHHDFEKTPDMNVMHMLLEKMQAGGADIVKLAVMPEDKQDVLRLLGITERFTQEYPQTPIITMSMGKMGMISRISGEVFGSCVTFGSHEKASAPGQIQMDELRQMLEKMHDMTK